MKILLYATFVAWQIKQKMTTKKCGKRLMNDLKQKYVGAIQELPY
jgi:hypothetical protein